MWSVGGGRGAEPISRRPPTHASTENSQNEIIVSLSLTSGKTFPSTFRHRLTHVTLDKCSEASAPNQNSVAESLNKQHKHNYHVKNLILRLHFEVLG